MNLLPDYFEPPVTPKPPLQQLFSAASAPALDLLQRLLTFDPLKRITAREVFQKNIPKFDFILLWSRGRLCNMHSLQKHPGQPCPPVSPRPIGWRGRLTKPNKIAKWPPWIPKDLSLMKNKKHSTSYTFSFRQTLFFMPV